MQFIFRFRNRRSYSLLWRRRAFLTALINRLIHFHMSGQDVWNQREASKKPTVKTVTAMPSQVPQQCFSNKQETTATTGAASAYRSLL